MGFTVVGYREGANGTTLQAVTPLADQHVTVSGDNVLVPSFASNLIGFYFLANDPVRAQVQSPSLRSRTFLEAKPLDSGVEPSTSLTVRLFPNRPIPLTPGEQMQFQAANVGTVSTSTGLIFLADKIDTLPSGSIETIRTTNTSTLTAGAWSLGALTLDQQLRAGRYALAGFKASSANLIAARAVIAGSGFRPGVVGTDAVQDYQGEVFRSGILGSYGEFAQTEPPQIEFLADIADSSQIVDLDVIKL